MPIRFQVDADRNQIFTDSPVTRPAAFTFCSTRRSLNLT